MQKKADLPGWEGPLCWKKEIRLFLVADFRSRGELAEFRQLFQAGCFGVTGAAKAAGTGDHGGGGQGDECQGADHGGSVFLLVKRGREIRLWAPGRSVWAELPPICWRNKIADHPG